MYYKARSSALNNNHDFHVVALLYRGKSLIAMGCNSDKTHPIAKRKYKSNTCAHLHAETNVLRQSNPGDRLIVLRFHKNGELTMAKPCAHCQKVIKKKQINKVVYSNWEGKFEVL